MIVYYINSADTLKNKSTSVKCGQFPFLCQNREVKTKQKLEEKAVHAGREEKADSCNSKNGGYAGVTMTCIQRPFNSDMQNTCLKQNTTKIKTPNLSLPS